MNKFHQFELLRDEFEHLLESRFTITDLLGQTFFLSRYTNRLQHLAKRRSMAIRLHQLRKLAFAFKGNQTHVPESLRPNNESDIYIAVCEKRALHSEP